LVLAVAFESIIKLTAFIAVGIFVTYEIFDGPAPLIASISHQLAQNQNFHSILQDSFLV